MNRFRLAIKIGHLQGKIAAYKDALALCTKAELAFDETDSTTQVFKAICDKLSATNDKLDQLCKGVSNEKD